MTLFHQELARADVNPVADQGKFAPRQPETADVLILYGIWIWEENFGGCLLNDRATNGAVQHIAGTLRRQAHHTIELPPGFRTVLGELLEGAVGQ